MAENNDMLSTQDGRPKHPIFVFLNDIRSVFKRDEVGMEILRIALPAALAMAADPIASLIDTAFIGHLGSVEIAAVGIAIAIFNQASKVTIFPLVSVTTSFVAEEDTVNRINNERNKMEQEKESNKNMELKSVVLQNDPVVDKLENASTETHEATVIKSGVSQIGSTVDNLENVPTETHEEKVMKSVVLQTDSTVDKLENVPTETDEANVNEREQLELHQEGQLDTNEEAEFKTTSCKSVDAPDINPNSAKTKTGRRNIPSASTALALGGVLGLLQAIFLIFLAKPFLHIMGVKSGSPMLSPALKYLTIRSLGAPAVLLSLAMQGIFRGFKDTKTPLYATVAGDLLNIILDPIFIFACRLGVSGAAIAHVLSQYVISLILLVILMKEVDLLPPSVKDLKLGKFLKNGGLLLARVIAATICVTLAASLAARLGTTQMAAFQVCLQVWMTSSLLADGLAVSGQAILACAFAEKDYQKAKAVAARVLQMGFVLGLGLALVVGLGLQFGSGIFSKEKAVIHMITIGIPFVAGTQPINSLAFVFDGVNFGASDFAYSAYSMVFVSVSSIGFLFVLSRSNGFVGIWLALTMYMFFRTFAGIWRMGTGTGPWRFLKGEYSTPIV